MIKKLTIIFLILAILATGGIIYLNNVYLPVKIKSLIIKGVEDQTGKKVTLGSVQFNIFKGLVLRDLVVYDNDKALISLEEGSCLFLIPPIFKKKIIVPVLRLKKPWVFVERRKDNTFNLQDLFVKKSEAKPAPAKKDNFSFFIQRLNIVDADIRFQDDTLPVAFIKEVKDLDLTVYLSLPASVKFGLNAQAPLNLKATGEYKIPSRELNARISLSGFSPKEFAPYYQPLGFSIPQGFIDGSINLIYQKDLLDVTIEAKSKNLNISIDKAVLNLNPALKADLKYDLQKQELVYSGTMDLSDSQITGLAGIDKINNISGRINFNNAGISTDKLLADAFAMPLEVKFRLTDFKNPVFDLNVLAAQKLSLAANFTLHDKLLTLNKCEGHYLDSAVTLAGTVDTSEAKQAEIKGAFDINLIDLKELFKKAKVNWDQMRPGGRLGGKFNLSGNVANFKACTVQADLASEYLSFYGLKGNGLTLNYNQSGGAINIPAAHLSLYDGTIETSAGMNLTSDNYPYWISADMQGVRIEKLKLDTGAKGADISGILALQTKVSGFSDDLNKLSGAGKISVSEGKLWQLNLFEGLGKVLFAKDFFKEIAFSEGSCNFSIQDKVISSDNLTLKSAIANLTGTVKIGFDQSLDASLDVEVQDQFVPLTGTFKDITTAIIGQAGRFGIIRITGTLKEPKYQFKPAVGDIIKGLKKAIFGD